MYGGRGRAASWRILPRSRTLRDQGIVRCPSELARYFGVSEGFFLALQADYDLLKRRREIDADLARITPRAA